MALELGGIHHLTAITAQAARNVDFYTRVLGMRLIKKTVNQDDVSAYHLFYGDGIASPGADLTFFDWPAAPARRGNHEVSRTGLRVASEAAVGGFTDVDTVTKVLVASIKAYGKSVEDARHISDIMFATVKFGVVTFEQLSNELGKVLPFAAQAGISFEELGAAIATLTVAGVQVDVATTALKNLAFQLPVVADRPRQRPPRRLPAADLSSRRLVAESPSPLDGVMPPPSLPPRRETNDVQALSATRSAPRRGAGGRAASPRAGGSDRRRRPCAARPRRTARRTAGGSAAPRPWRSCRWAA